MTAPEGSESTDRIELVVPREGGGARLDRFVAVAIGVSRSELQRWIERGRVTVDGAPRDASTKVRPGEHIVILREPAASTRAEPDASVQFAVLFKDEDIAVVDKPAGLVVHPARGHEGGTLVNGLLALGLFRQSDVVDGQGDLAHARPGVVHRLDKGTSGVMVVARTAGAREHLKRQFQAHTIERAYVAIVVGDARDRTFATLHARHPRDRLRFTTRVSHGKAAVTHLRVLERLSGATFVECTLETGRTHQIRVHLAENGHPVLGDSLYGKPPADARLRELGAELGHQALHARVLGLVHPRTGDRMHFESPPPADFCAVLASLV